MGARGKQSAAGLSVVDATGARLVAPDDLSSFARAKWTEIVDSLPADWLRPSDACLLRAYCVAAEVHELSSATLMAEGLTVPTMAGVKAHPAASIMAASASTMANVAMKLRLCPSSRYTAERAGTKARNAVAAAKRPWHG